MEAIEFKCLQTAQHLLHGKFTFQCSLIPLTEQTKYTPSPAATGKCSLILR